MTTANRTAAAAAPGATDKSDNAGIGGYISLAFAIIFFSGLAASSHWCGIFDFTTLNGGLGQLVSSAADRKMQQLAACS